MRLHTRPDEYNQHGAGRWPQVAPPSTSMSPYLGTFFGYPIPIFAVTLDAGVLLGITLATRLAAGSGLRWNRFLDASLWALAGALGGARLGYALLHPHDFSANIVTVLAVWEGGLTLPGAVTVGAPVAVLAARAHRLPVGTTLDCAAAGLALGQAVGRLGCLAAGCAVGLPATQPAWWAPVLPDAAGALAARFPSQIVEAAAEGLLCLALVWLIRRGPERVAPGGAACAYLFVYGAMRLALEPLRGDSTFVGPLATASVWSLGAVALGAASWLYVRRTVAPRVRREGAVASA